jgi:hypothetical protein
MSPDDEEARARRAAELREQIRKVESGEAEEEPPKSPREFIERKMREEEEREKD